MIKFNLESSESETFLSSYKKGKNDLTSACMLSLDFHTHLHTTYNKPRVKIVRLLLIKNK